MLSKYIHNTSYNLTRYLYARDEVELSLIVSLLEKKDIMECYFWAFELYYSGYDISQLVWKIFYDFYFHYNSNLEVFIHNKLNKWRENNDYTNIAYIIQNLFRSKISHIVFTLRQKILHENYNFHFKAKRGRPPNWLNKYDKKFIPLIISISNSEYYNIAFNLYNLFEKNDYDNNFSYLIFVEIMKYFSKDHDHNHYCSINNFTDNELNDDVKKYWKLRNYKDDKHYLLSMIIHLMTNENNNNKKNISVIPRDKHLEWINNIESEQIYPVYKTLKSKKLYNINNLISCFQLVRNSFYDNDKLSLKFINNFWELYAFNTPCWNKRFTEFNAYIDNKNINKVIFDNDNNLENFYDKYGYEPDEQINEIQNTSIGYINKISKNIWYETLFNENKFNDLVIKNDTNSLFIY